LRGSASLGDELHADQPAGGGCGRLRELRDAAALEIGEPHRLRHEQREVRAVDADHLDLVEPVAADVGMVSPQVLEDLRAELRSRRSVRCAVRSACHRAPSCSVVPPRVQPSPASLELRDAA